MDCGEKTYTVQIFFFFFCLVFYVEIFIFYLEVGVLFCFVLFFLLSRSTGSIS